MLTTRRCSSGKCPGRPAGPPPSPLGKANMGRTNAKSLPASPSPKRQRPRWDEPSPGAETPVNEFFASFGRGSVPPSIYRTPVLRSRMQRFRLPGRDEVPVGVEWQVSGRVSRRERGEVWVTMVWTRWPGGSCARGLCVYERLLLPGLPRGSERDTAVSVSSPNFCCLSFELFLSLYRLPCFRLPHNFLCLPSSPTLGLGFLTTILPTVAATPTGNSKSHCRERHRKNDVALLSQPESPLDKLAGEAEEARNAFPAPRDPTPTRIPSGAQPA